MILIRILKGKLFIRRSSENENILPYVTRFSTSNCLFPIAFWSLSDVFILWGLLDKKIAFKHRKVFFTFSCIFAVRVNYEVYFKPIFILLTNFYNTFYQLLIFQTTLQNITWMGLETRCGHKNKDI